jgi:predicted regulator of Ras-like GTPase activity (Roadblock/LC7/MglB family)
MFGTILEDAVTGVKGAVAAILMGFDGIPVDTFQVANSEEDIETIGMEFSVLLKEVKKAAEALETGLATEMSVQTDAMSIVLRIISDEYFLAIAVKNNGNLGKARYLLRIAAPKIHEALGE